MTNNKQSKEKPSAFLARCQRLSRDYREFLRRHRYLSEQLTSITNNLQAHSIVLANTKLLDFIEQRLQELQNDEWLDKLFSAAQNESQVKEIETYMQKWGVGKPEQAFKSPAHCMVWHANKHGDGNILRYLRKANKFNKRRAKVKIIDGAKRWRKKNREFLIERDGKIVSYGQNRPL